MFLSGLGVELPARSLGNTAPSGMFGLELACVDETASSDADLVDAAALADFVRARDVMCRHPRCRRAAATCELDHVIPWDPDGTTSEDNVAAPCPAHHDLEEQPGWQVALHPDRRMEWITPTGHTYWSDPTTTAPGEDQKNDPATR